MNISGFDKFKDNFKEMGKNIPGFGVPFESKHLSGSQLYNFYFNKLRDKNLLKSVRQHLNSCEQCRKHIELFESLYPDRKPPKIEDLFIDYQYAISNAYYKLSQYTSKNLNWKQKFILKIDKAIQPLSKLVDFIPEKAKEVSISLKEAIKLLSYCKEVEVLDNFNCPKDLTINGADENLVDWGCNKYFSITLSTYYDKSKKTHPLDLVIQLKPDKGIMCPSVIISLIESTNALTYKAETNPMGWVEFTFENIFEIDSELNIKILPKS